LFLSFLVCSRDHQLVLMLDTCTTDGSDGILENTLSRSFDRVGSDEIELSSWDLYELGIGWVTCYVRLLIEG
jgi:hypothetical protein